MNNRPTFATANLKVSRRFALMLPLLLLLLLLLALMAGRASAATFNVSSSADSGPGSLREAIAQANANGAASNVINLNTLDIALTSGELAITRNLTINGAFSEVQRSGDAGTPEFRLFRIQTGVHATVNNLRVSDGANFFGGGINNDGNLTLNNCVVSNNSGGNGGGIYNSGTLTMNSSSIVNNRVNGSGAGLYNAGTVNGTNITIANNIIGDGNTGNGAGLNNESGTCTLSSATIAFNRSTSGAGVFVSGGAVSVSNSIIAANVDFQQSESNFAGTLTSQGFNLLGLPGGFSGGTIVGDTTGNVTGVGSSAARLAPLADNGGPSPTVALYAGSPAIDAGAGNLAADQRGQSRTTAASDGDNDGTVRRDLGAFELQKYVVTSTSDSGAGTLRQALDDNNLVGGGFVVFNLPGAAGSVRRLQPITPLSSINRPVQIDGYTQPGARPNTLATGSDAVLLVELLSPINDGLDLRADNCVIRGLAVSGSGGNGIILRGANNAWLHGNHIGVGASGSETIGNGGIGDVGGIQIEGDNNLVGTNDDRIDDAAERNVISGNCHFNVRIDGGDNNRVYGNYIGTYAQGNAPAGGCSSGAAGVVIRNATGNVVGGSAVGIAAPIKGNVISGNRGPGISLQASGNRVHNNFIGWAADRVTPLGNDGDGISVSGSDNTLGDTNSNTGFGFLSNQIANNAGAGVRVTAGTNNRIFGNVIISNGGLGLDLGAAGVTPNDANDADGGANNLQNFPLLTSAVNSDGLNTVVTGTLNSAASTSYIIQLFRNSACDPAGHGEGQAFIGRLVRATDAAGNLSFNLTLPPAGVPVAPGEFLTATATTNVFGNANTSEFSPCRLVESLPNSLRFLQTDYTVDETTATATVIVRRVGGGSFGPATVDYATGGGTATGGAACGAGDAADYVAANGTLSWSADDYSDKTISVTICNDALAEVNETIGLSLSNPTGGAVLNTPAAANVTIFDDETLFLVTNLNDAGAGSLRQAITNANSLPGDHVITFAPGVVGTINLLNSLPAVTSRAQIVGPGASVLSVARSRAPGTPAFRVLTVAGGADVVISGLTLTNGRVEAASDTAVGGGGVALTGGGALTIDNCRVIGNVAAFAGPFGDAAGGGIHVAGGAFTLRHSLVSGNSAVATGGTGRGGGLIIIDAAAVVLESTIRDNTATGQPFGGGVGGGIVVAGTTATLTLERSTVSGNTAASVDGGAAGQGGGLAQLNAGPVTIINSTIDGNTAGGDTADTGGGGLFVNFGRMTLSHSTVTHNGTTSSGATGGIGGGLRRLNGGIFILKNTIVALNTSTRGGPDLSTTNMTSQGFNLFGNTTGGTGFVASDLQNVNPQLGPLQDNGGPTFTRALLAGSPATDGGDNAGAPSTDQRGEARVVDGNADSNAVIDIGAYERGPVASPTDGSIFGRVTLAANGVGVANVTVTLGGATSASTASAADGSYSFPDLDSGNYTVTPARPGFTFTPPAQTIGVDGDGFQLNLTATPNAPAPQPANGSVLISEFRTGGATSSDDEFIELYNNTNADIALGGYRLDAVAGYAVTIPAETVLPARGHYLIAHATGYTLGAHAAADLTYDTFELPDGAGLALLNPSGTVVDAVGFGTTPAPYLEGASLSGGDGTPAVGHSYVRKLSTGLPQDTGDNAQDFLLISADGGSYGGVQSTLGAAGPEGTTSPVQRNATIKASLIDPAASSASAPNRVRDASATGANAALGTLSVRRAFRNNTGQTLTRLRFRIVDLTTATAPAGTSDLRALTSSNVSVTRTNGTNVLVRGTTLEQAAAQLLGGGLNSTLAAGLISLDTPLGPGQSVNVQFLLGVEATGRFRFLVNVEAQ
ncbi:MAG: choice-of-anchor Q domain-containing protein [Pyrinomonadaceae bacterium]